MDLTIAKAGMNNFPLVSLKGISLSSAPSTGRNTVYRGKALQSLILQHKCMI